MSYRVDEIDKRILYHLARDARNTSAPMIAEDVDVSPGTIRNRIRQMESEGIIAGYSTQIDYERAEGLLTNLFVCNTSTADQDRLSKQALDVRGVVHVCELVTGRGNLLVKAVGTDTRDLSRIARELTGLGIDVEDEALIKAEEFDAYRPYGPSEGREMSSMTDYMSLSGGAEVVDVRVDDTSPMTDLTLREATEDGHIPEEVLVIAIERDDDVITPKGNTPIRTGDLVTLFARRGVDDDLIATFAGSAAEQADS